MKKWIARIVLTLIVLAVAAFFARNFIARQSIESGVTKITGFPLEIESVDLGIFQSHVEVHGLKMQNPPDFPEKMFVDLPVFLVDYKLGSMISGEPHINDLNLELKELVIVKNAKGESNVQRLKGVSSSETKPGEKEPPKSDKKTKFHVDTLHLKVGTVIVKDYSGATPTTRTIPVNIDRTYQNITDGTDITKLILLTALSKAGIPDLGIDLGSLNKGLENVTGKATEVLKSGTEALDKATKGIFDGVKGIGGEKKK